MAALADDEKKEMDPVPVIGVNPNAAANPIKVDYDQITDKEVIEMMKDDADQILIIDVRDPDLEEGDFPGGKIKGAVNVPTFDFVDTLPQIITKDNASKRTVIFVSMTSQARGPQCYRLYKKARSLLCDKKEAADSEAKEDEFTKIVNSIKLDEKDKEALLAQKVFVLKGGMHRWINYHKENADITEGFNAKCWEMADLGNDGLSLYHKNEQ